LFWTHREDKINTYTQVVDKELKMEVDLKDMQFAAGVAIASWNETFYDIF
jgi:hypothetical protein